MRERKVCPECNGYAVKLCPWCKIDIKDEKGKVIGSKPGSGCRACEGKSIFSCTFCEGKGYLPQGEIELGAQEQHDENLRG